MDYRLKKATELLINDELNVKEIAFFCGFEDPNYFSKVFKKRYGRSPLEFKNNNKSVKKPLDFSKDLLTL